MITDSNPHDEANLNAADPSAVGRSAVAIVSSLWEKVEALVQLEMKLALAEAEEKIGTLKSELVTAAIGGSVAFAGMLTLIAALVAVLALAMPWWLAALLTGVALTGGGFFLLRQQKTINTPHPANEALTRAPRSATSTTKETSHGSV